MLPIFIAKSGSPKRSQPKHAKTVTAFTEFSYFLLKDDTLINLQTFGLRKVNS